MADIDEMYTDGMNIDSINKNVHGHGVHSIRGTSLQTYVPPLEDMTELVQQVNAIRESRHTPKTEVPKAQVKVQEKKIVSNGNRDVDSKKTEKDPPKSDKQSSESTFGGMKKGFLFGGGNGPSKKTTTAKVVEPTTKKEEIPFIKPKESNNANLKLPELSASQDPAQAFLQNKDDWLNNDLLKNVEKNEKLVKRLADPTFMAAITEFQTNPQEAAKKYQNNPEMQEFFQDFCGLMGNHFSNLGSQDSNPASRPSPQSTIQTKANDKVVDMKVHSSTNPNQPTAFDEERMAQILADPEVKDILLDPRVQKLFEVLRNDPFVQNEIFVKEADPVLQQRLRKLVEVGLLQFQR